MHSAHHLLATLLLLTAASVAAEPEAYRLGVQSFVADMAAEHGFDAAELGGLLARAGYSQSVIDAMSRPYEAKPWREYRELFLTPERIRGGLAFWRANADALKRAEADFGVPPEVIVAIIGVETNYGGHLGRYRALDALTTLAFCHPTRAAFFRSELEALLLLAREEGIDPAEVRGSYAGALGKPQFIPSSYRAYAVDFDADHRRDLWSSDADVIGSVANYFKQHGWQPGEPVAFPAAPERELPRDIQLTDKRPLAPSMTLAALREAGVTWEAKPLAPTTPATLIQLDGPAGEHWIGLDNFYTVTRYNHSNLYAMAVHQLSEAIRMAHERAG